MRACDSVTPGSVTVWSGPGFESCPERSSIPLFRCCVQLLEASREANRWYAAYLAAEQAGTDLST